MTSWYGRPTFIGQARRFRRAVLILVELTRREIVAHPWWGVPVLIALCVLVIVVDIVA